MKNGSHHEPFFLYVIEDSRFFSTLLIEAPETEINKQIWMCHMY